MANAGGGGMGLRRRKMWALPFLLGSSCFFFSSLFLGPPAFLCFHTVSLLQLCICRMNSTCRSASILRSFPSLLFHSHSRSSFNLPLSNLLHFQPSVFLLIDKFRLTLLT